MPDLHLGQKADDVINWLIVTFPWLFDAISEVVAKPVGWLTDLLLWVPPGALITALAGLAWVARRWAFAAFAAAAFALIASMRLWDATMETLAVVLLAAAIAAAVGIPAGIAAARRRALDVAVRPLLDVMQTLPVFVYLIPAVFLLGVGVVPGVVATTIFAVPPAVRLTALGIRQVDGEVVEAARAFGAHPRQILREVQLPLALPSIMTGVNQVIMLALSMVVVAGLAGASGLGAVVVRAVTQLDVAAGFEGGLAVVLLAIYLDRLTAAFAAPHDQGPQR
jgi:glycine betaine/proline transport system permease protein